MEVLLVSGDPVPCDLLLGCRQLERSVTNQIPQPILQFILDACVPCSRRVGMRPEVVDVIRTAQCRCHQIVQFVSFRVGAGDSVQIEHLFPERRRIPICSLVSGSAQTAPRLIRTVAPGVSRESSRARPTAGLPDRSDAVADPKTDQTRPESEENESADGQSDSACRQEPERIARLRLRRQFLQTQLQQRAGTFSTDGRSVSAAGDHEYE